MKIKSKSLNSRLPLRNLPSKQYFEYDGRYFCRGAHLANCGRVRCFCLDDDKIMDLDSAVMVDLIPVPEVILR